MMSPDENRARSRVAVSAACRVVFCVLIGAAWPGMTGVLADDVSGSWITGGWPGPGLGQPLNQVQSTALPRHVFANGDGLPEGAGTAIQGAVIYAQQCASCHGEQAQGGKAMELVGDHSLLATEFPDRGIAAFWPNAATLFEYVYRSMPPEQPASLEVDEIYAVLAYVLELNDLLRPGTMLDARVLSGIDMPNHQGFRTIAR